MIPTSIEFPQPKNYILEKELGQGACGRTVVIFDPIINERFVCKKYSPIEDSLVRDLFTNFISEIKLLYLLNHPNIVRVFNYYLYPEKFLGYIMMEYVIGSEIDDYLKLNPENINEIFRQVIEGFFHLEYNKILHRDIRPMNIMVNQLGIVKIIDFGFGKQTIVQDDFDKSISLNWWCEPPKDFDDSIYDFRTEVYFVGKLFEGIIADYGIKHFKSTELLKKMCNKNPLERISSFEYARKELLSDKFVDISFENEELLIYRNFSNGLYSIASKIDSNAKYYDVDTVQTRLEECLKKVMLEEELPSNNLLIKCFINGDFYFSKRDIFYVHALRSFVEFFRMCGQEKRNIIISNLQSKLDSLPRYDQQAESDADIPF
ncbi:MAG: protein kinase family protein [Polynucleobacter sp.]